MKSLREKAKLMSGNEAIARGAIEAGVGFCSSYPGTPSTQIMTNLIQQSQNLDFRADWSVNEKVAMEAAVGASWLGVPALCSMKSLGLNVAADFLLNLNLSGTGTGGIVVVVCDDPQGHSSSNEQDSRFYAKAASIPLLEPSNPQQAKNLTRYAFQLSKKFEVPVLLRSTTRLSHSRTIVEIDTSDPPVYEILDAIPERLYNVPHPHIKHKNLLEKLEIIRDLFDESIHNQLIHSNDSDLLLISSGVCHRYALECADILGLDHMSHLGLATTYPLPYGLIMQELSSHDRIVFIEETDPFIEEETLACASQNGHEETIFYGKRSGHVPSWGEMNVDRVIESVREILGLNRDDSERLPNEDTLKKGKSLLINRPLTFCAGCTHRNVFWAIRKLRRKLAGHLIVAGDIGCYSLGVFYDSAVNTMQAMGSGIGVSTGIAQLIQRGLKSTIIAVAGDSTFYHACIPALVDARNKNLDLTFLILDNSTTAMTGFQPHPGSSFQFERNTRVPIESVVRGIGPDRLVVADATSISNTYSILEKLVNQPGLKVCILESVCQLERGGNQLRLEAPMILVNEALCKGDSCRVCVSQYGCTAMSWITDRGKPLILQDVCVRCGSCIDVCPHGAITREE